MSPKLIAGENQLAVETANVQLGGIVPAVDFAIHMATSASNFDKSVITSASFSQDTYNLHTAQTVLDKLLLDRNKLVKLNGAGIKGINFVDDTPDVISTALGKLGTNNDYNKLVKQLGFYTVPNKSKVYVAAENLVELAIGLDVHPGDFYGEATDRLQSIHDLVRKVMDSSYDPNAVPSQSSEDTSLDLPSFLGIPKPTSPTAQQDDDYQFTASQLGEALEAVTKLHDDAGKMAGFDPVKAKEISEAYNGLLTTLGGVDANQAEKTIQQLLENKVTATTYQNEMGRILNANNMVESAKIAETLMAISSKLNISTEEQATGLANYASQMVSELGTNNLIHQVERAKTLGSITAILGSNSTEEATEMKNYLMNMAEVLGPDYTAAVVAAKKGVAAVAQNDQIGVMLEKEEGQDLVAVVQDLQTQKNDAVDELTWRRNQSADKADPIGRLLYAERPQESGEMNEIVDYFHRVEKAFAVLSAVDPSLTLNLGGIEVPVKDALMQQLPGLLYIEVQDELQGIEGGAGGANYMEDKLAEQSEVIQGNRAIANSVKAYQADINRAKNPDSLAKKFDEKYQTGEHNVSVKLDVDGLMQTVGAMNDVLSTVYNNWAQIEFDPSQPDKIVSIDDSKFQAHAGLMEAAKNIHYIKSVTSFADATTDSYMASRAAFMMKADGPIEGIETVVAGGLPTNYEHNLVANK